MTTPKSWLAAVMDALADMLRGWRYSDLWLSLGWRDVLFRYRRSHLGPLWITLSMAIVAGAMGTLYSAIMQRAPGTYIPYLLVGFISWNLLSTMITEGCQLFVANAAAIKEMPIPGSVYLYRLVWRNLIVLAHNMIVYVIGLAIFQLDPFPELLLFIPALLLIVLNSMWIGLLLGLINARLRDAGQIIHNMMRLAFFLTPVIWYAASAKGFRSAFVYLNPFYYFIEMFRAPLLGATPDHMVWTMVITVTIFGWLITLPLYGRWRRNIIYWI